MSKLPLRWRICRYINRLTGIEHWYEIRDVATGECMGTWRALCKAEAWFDFCHEADFSPDACGVRSDWIVRRVPQVLAR